ncbi:MAG: AraC family transcriptional regulator [Gammaproteobacteria bacterium]
MLFEPTTLAAAARLIGETLKDHYSQDPLPVFEKADIDPTRLDVSGARYPYSSMQKLWAASIEATGDPCFGLIVGRNIRPTTFHALGFSWVSSRTLLESLQRLCRYSRLLTTAPSEITLTEADGMCTLHDQALADRQREYHPASADAFFMAVIGLCRQASNKHFRPAQVCLRYRDPNLIETYVNAFDCPVHFNADHPSITFNKGDLERPLPGDNLELALTHDRIAEEYIAALNPETISTEVRKLLIELLPSGEASQQHVASEMNRSLSTLQRQLAAEGTSYKTIREQTRQELAEKYVREGRYSLSQIAYLLGFSDQSNFSRAFRRWTGHSPGNYAKN